MDKLMNVAQNALQGSSHSMQQPGQGVSASDGSEWGSLGAAAQHFDALDINKDGKVDFQDFQSKMMGSSGGAPQVAQGNAESSSAIDKLLGMYQQHTGKQFGGGSDEFDVLTNLASSKTNVPFRKEILQQMVSWKMNNMF